jgi:hypothetical protein
MVLFGNAILRSCWRLFYRLTQEHQRNICKEQKEIIMHILAILFVLAALVLAFGIIGGMLFAHRERIGAALVGHVVTSSESQRGGANVTQLRANVPVKSEALVLPLAA